MTVDTQISKSDLQTDLQSVAASRGANSSASVSGVNVMELLEVVRELSSHIQSLLSITMMREGYNSHRSSTAPTSTMLGADDPSITSIGISGKGEGTTDSSEGITQYSKAHLAVENAELGLVKCVGLLYKTLWTGPLLPLSASVSSGGDLDLKGSTCEDCVDRTEPDKSDYEVCGVIINQCICNIDNMRKSFESIWATNHDAAGLSTKCNFYSSHHYLALATDYGPNILLLILLAVRDYLLMMMGDVSEDKGSTNETSISIEKGKMPQHSLSNTVKLNRRDARQCKKTFRQHIKQCEQLLMRLVNVLRCGGGHYIMSCDLSIANSQTPEEQSMDKNWIDTIYIHNGDESQRAQFPNIVKHVATDCTPTLTEVLFPGNFFKSITVEILKRIRSSVSCRRNSCPTDYNSNTIVNVDFERHANNRIKQNGVTNHSVIRNDMSADYKYRNSFLLSKMGIYLTGRAESLVYFGDSEWIDEENIEYGQASNTDSCKRNSTDSRFGRSQPLDSAAAAAPFMSIFTFINQKRVPPLLLLLMDDESQRDNHICQRHEHAIVKRDKCLFDAIWHMKAGYDEVEGEYVCNDAYTNVPHSSSKPSFISPCSATLFREVIQCNQNHNGASPHNDTMQQQMPKEVITSKALHDRFRPPPLLPPPQLNSSSRFGSTVIKNATVSKETPNLYSILSPTVTPANFTEYNVLSSSSTSLLQESNASYFDFEFLESIGADSGSTSTRSLSPVSCPPSSFLSPLGTSLTTSCTLSLPSLPLSSFAVDSNIPRSISPHMHNDSKDTVTNHQIQKHRSKSFSPSNNSASSVTMNFRNVRLEVQKKKKNSELLRCNAPTSVTAIIDKRSRLSQLSTTCKTQSRPVLRDMLSSTLRGDNNSNNNNNINTSLCTKTIVNSVEQSHFSTITGRGDIIPGTGAVVPGDTVKTLSVTGGNKRCRSSTHPSMSTAKTCTPKRKKCRGTPTKASQQMTSAMGKTSVSRKAHAKPTTPKTPNPTVLLDLLSEGQYNTVGEAVGSSTPDMMVGSCIGVSASVNDDDNGDYDDIYLERSPALERKRMKYIASEQHMTVGSPERVRRDEVVSLSTPINSNSYSLNPTTIIDSSTSDVNDTVKNNKIQFPSIMSLGLEHSQKRDHRTLSPTSSLVQLFP